MTQTAEPHTYHWSKAQYYAIAELGFFESQRVELIEGEIIEMSPMSSQHAGVVVLVQQALAAILREGCYIRVQSTLDVDEVGQPEPDIAVVAGSVRDHMDHHPTSALLVVEVADTSLRYDRMTKAAIYARAGIAEYWIVNLKDFTLEINRNPAELEAQPRYGYKLTMRLTREDTISPLVAPDRQIAVTDLLPQL